MKRLISLASLLTAAALPFSQAAHAQHAEYNVLVATHAQANGVAPFTDGRTEFHGEKFFVDHNAASGLMEPENLFRLLEEYKIEATTLMRTQSAATKLLDHLDGQQKVYSDDIATIHLRKQDALHTIEPAVDAKAK